ncbi:uncharacterized protein BCR38DRAFT_354928, partial [Pseudomassariella vexata]
QPFGTKAMEKSWRTWEVNVKGACLVIQALLPLLLKVTEKTIVNVMSADSLALILGASSEPLSNLAVLRLSESLALDYAHKGLVAYSVHQGLDLAKGAPEAVTDQPELTSNTVVYLTRKRREWLARRHISCSWDMRELIAQKDEIVRSDLPKFNVSFSVALVYHRARGRVPRNSY